MHNTVATSITTTPKPRYCHPVIITGSFSSVKLWRLFSHWHTLMAARCARSNALAMVCRIYTRQRAVHLLIDLATSDALTCGAVGLVVAVAFIILNIFKGL